MKVGLFGTFHNYGPRNTTIPRGLTLAGAEVVVVHEEVEKMRMDRAGDLSLIHVLKRVGRKLAAWTRLLLRSRELSGVDYVIVLYPGLLDLPLAFLITKMLGVPLVYDASISMYDSLVIDRELFDANTIRALLLKKVESILVGLADVLLVDTPQMGDFLADLYGIPRDTFVEIPLGTNDDLYKPSISQQDAAQSLKVFFFGLYNPLQGTPTIVRACELLREYDDIQFVMVGAGGEREKVLAYAKARQLRHIEFVDIVTEERLVEYIQDCDIMLGIFGENSIAHRVIPNKVFAGLACGKPVITGRLTALEAALEHKNHIYFCEPHNPASLAEAILTLGNDAELRRRLSAGALNIYKERYSPKAIGKQLIRSLTHEEAT